MPRKLVTLILMLCGISLFSQEEQILSELKQADKYTRDENYQEALEHIEIALELEPLHLLTLEKKVNIMILSNQEKEMLKDLSKNISIYPQQAEYYYLRGLIYLYRQKYSKAIEDLVNAQYYSMPEKHMEKIHFNRGTASYYYGDFSKAEEDFREAINLNPRSAATFHSWGMLKYEMGLYEEAMEYFNKAIQYQDNNGISYYNLGMTYYKQGDLKNACHNFNRACTLNNRNGCKIYYLECTE